MTDAEIQKRLADETRIAFESSLDPHYSVPTDVYAGALLELLKHHTPDGDLAAVGDQIFQGLRAYFDDCYLGQLLLSVEAFAKFLLQFTDADKFRMLVAKGEEESKKLSLAPVLKALNLSYKSNLNSSPDKFIGAPRFAEHVCRVIATRNQLAHEAPNMSKRAKAQVFESICVFLLFAIAEHFEALLSTLLIRGTKADADVTRALALISSAADAGFVPAMRQLSDVQFDVAEPHRNSQEAEEWLRRAAQHGDAAAMRKLGERLLDADGLPRDVREGRRWLALAAETGLSSAMRAYASRVLDGDGFERDVTAGEKWLRRAAAAGDEFAKWDLGYRLLDGDVLTKNQSEGFEILSDCSFGGGPPNIQLAWLGAFDTTSLAKDVKVGPRWLIKAANAGLPRAMCILGDRHLKGDGIPRDYKKAAYWLRRAAEAGDSGAWESYSTLLLDNDKLGERAQEGEYWLRKAAGAAMPYSMWAVPDLAQRLMTGHGLRQDVNEAVDWLCRSLEIPAFPGPVGALPGQRVMEWIDSLFNGDSLPIRPDLAERLLRKAANLGWSWPMRELGLRLVQGRHLDRNVIEGTDWLLRAAKTTDRSSMYLYGMMRLQGDLMLGNEKEGALWLRRSAEDGFAEAMRELGNRLMEGIGLPRNVTEGMTWLREAMEMGYPPAIFDFGRRLYFGNGIAKDEERGIVLAKKSAGAGDAGAKAFVAIAALEKADESILDHDTAITWLTDAASAGNVTASLNLALRLFEGDGLQSDVRRAERLVRNVANAGEPVAMRLLGILLHQGQHLGENQQEAFAWLERAASAGDIQAKAYIDENRENR
ncbi:MAG: sel1 repeat family protein [Acidobacteriota bacterium]|nr:sel1 repeat family protein [Acidobacteriota bacterium]